MNRLGCLWRPTIRLATILTLASVGLAACGSSSSSTSGSAGASAGGSAKSGGSPITIGLSVAETGVEAIPSLPAGYKQAVAEANAAGGIDVGGVRHPVRLIVLDNRSDPALLGQQTHTLVLNDKAVALVSGCCDLNVIQAPLVNALRVPLSGTAIPTELMAKVNGTYSWNAFASLLKGASNYFTAVVPSLGKTNMKVAIIGNNNPQGQGANALFAVLARAAHFQVTEQDLVPVGTTDYSSFINKAKSTDTDNLVGQMTGPDCFAMWKQMKALGYQPKTALMNQCGAIPTWAGLGRLGNGAMLGLNWTPTSGLPDAEKLAATFSKVFPNDVADQEVAVNSYNAMEVLFSAIERAGSTDPAKINAAMGHTNGSFPLGTVKFDGHNNWAGSGFTGQWQNGKVVQVYPQVAGVKAEFPVGGLAP